MKSPVEQPAILFAEGTQRTRLPEDTLRDITPKLPACGITRVADVTRLDRPGIPTCCAIRPAASKLQVTNGKGATKAAAQVSALMEAVELFHAESSEAYEQSYQSANTLSASSRTLDQTRLQSFRDSVYYSDDLKMNWVRGECLGTGESLWIPAGAIFFDQNPSVHQVSTNGLASGNHKLEASLHALYEVIERDAASRMSEGGRIRLGEHGGVIEPGSIRGDSNRKFIDSLSTDSKIVICNVNSVIDVYSFWVLLLNPAALSSLSLLSIGWGTHRNRDIALSRALTEAAQSRLTVIHGAREDLIELAGYQNSNTKNRKAHRFFEHFTSNMQWNELPTFESADKPDLVQDWDYLCSELTQAGYDSICRFDLTRPDIDIPVVKMLVPGLQFNVNIL